ncbi:hydrolase [Carboxylicivirga sp. M1479]|uniref:hydrolase n=1 Tax=Carboxylicivirga sp. M1479 TaxID=2594476 RepID=UPI001177453D|nr:hydrolase [Carboxylicivirga sp. M1479]TRX63182.1 hydrolase [Carboxylicivirga sp. M1479]
MRLLKENVIGVVVDIQERLFPHINEHEQLEKNTKILVQGLKALEAPFLITEQYKKGLGDTIEGIETLVKDDAHFEKMAFSCCDDPKFMEALETSTKRTVVLAGMETHICMLQTAIDLRERGYTPVIVEDCVSSRTPENKAIAIERMRQEGVIVTSYESILFELCRVAGSDAFKTISKLVK